MRAPDDFPEASGDEVKSSTHRPPSPAAVDGAKKEDDVDVNHSFLPPPPNTIERRTPPRPVYRYAAAAATATSAPPQPPMPPTTSSHHSYFNPGYYAYGQYSQHYNHAAGYNYGHHHYHRRHPAGYRPTVAQGKGRAGATTADVTPITPRDDDQLPSSVTMSPIPPASVPPQRRDDTGSNTARPSTPPPVSEAIPDSDINDKDVLSGRGGGTNNHPGNKQFRSLVDQYRSEYVLSKKWAKREIARNIVDSIRSDGGRFLKKEGSIWHDIGDQKAREKTSQALREGLAAKMRAAYAESSGASSSPHQASSISQRHRPESAPAEAPTPSPTTSTRHHEADYYHIPPHGYQHYSPDSVSGHVHPQPAEYHLDPTSSASYEPYDYAHPYEYSPEAYGPPPPSSPIKRRRLTYSTYSSGEPKQTEAV